LSEAASVL
jgi:adenylosuccinate lyase